MSTRDLLEAAIEYAERGWPVLPIKPREKVPAGSLVPHGLRDATIDAATIRAWWKRLPEANVGLATGIAFDALDVDGDDGVRALGEAIPLDGPTIDGPTVTTGTGVHVYVAVTGIGNRAGLVPHVNFERVAADTSSHHRAFTRAGLDIPGTSARVILTSGLMHHCRQLRDGCSNCSTRCRRRTRRRRTGQRGRKVPTCVERSNRNADALRWHRKDSETTCSTEQHSQWDSSSPVAR